jgi:DNA invertase Pin-like site-specific DNA recombinase
MASVAELEAGMISARTRAALQAAKARGVKLGGNRGVSLGAETSATGRAIQTARSEARAVDLAPTLSALKAEGITSLGALAKALTERGIPTARGLSAWTPMQVSRLLARIEQ